MTWFNWFQVGFDAYLCIVIAVVRSELAREIHNVNSHVGFRLP